MEAFSFLEENLAQCNNQHELCQQKSSRLPHRVLDVKGSSNIIKLIETNPFMSGRYNALSYCWGGDVGKSLFNKLVTGLQLQGGNKPQNFTTTTANIGYGLL